MTSPSPIVLGPQLCGDLAAGAAREWLLTDGMGGYASGTANGLRTRRYHALLAVSGETPATRHVGLVALDPVVTLPSGVTVRLGTHEWSSGAVAPEGYKYLETFALVDGLPRWRWRIGDVVLERELAMIYGTPALAAVHRLVSGTSTVTIEALCTWRDGHSERHAYGDLDSEQVADGVVIAGAYRLRGPGWRPAGEWYTGVHHREEAARGLNADEDLWYAGSFSAELDAGGTIEVSAWAGDLAVSPPPPSAVVEAARQRARSVVAAAKPADSTGATLALAADAFVIAREHPDVMAGYPWFGTWSRDTMISYEGLFLTTNRADEGRELLRGYAATLSEGMCANTADTGQTEYNTVDGTLWFAHAIERHVAATGDTDLAAELLDAMVGVVAAHVTGTRYGIRVDPADGLISQGADGYALTWMDARVDGVAVTPRTGKPVEINALWVNALAGIWKLHILTGTDPGDLPARHDRAKASFRSRYPAPTGWLHDVIDGPVGDDAALRPNQLLAWSLPYAPMDDGAEPVMRAVGEHLLTPLGLRSLAPGAEGYQGRHRGAPAERDRAYHEGTIWPWLIGPYSDAAVRLRRVPVKLLAGIEAHLSEWGLGSVSETADGDPPHGATGCPFQAWSVAEALRVHQKTG